MATALKEQKFVEGIRGCTDRIRQLREESVHGAVPTISMERAVLLTEAYQQYEGTCSIPVLRGKAFYYLMAHRTLYLGRGSLIVGEKGPKPWAAPTFPELCCHTLEDFDTLNSRERVFHPGSHGRHAPPPAELQRSDFPEDAGTLPAEGSGNLPQGLGPAGVL